MRKLLALGAALSLAAGPAFASASLDVSVSVTGGSGGITNSIVMTDKSGTAETNYPFQFGRPFLDGAIPHAPAVLINGVAAVSQADVKNRYPDGSVEFAVMAVVVPTIPANGSVTLTFADTTTNSNTPLTAAQMEASAYNFDAAFGFTPNAGGTLTSFSGDATNARTMLANGDYTLFTSGPVAQTIILGDTTTARKYDVGFGGGFHPFRPSYYATFWPATGQVSVRVVAENDRTDEYEDVAYSATVTAGQTSPTTIAVENLSNLPTGTPVTGLTFTAPETAAYTGYATVTGTPSGSLASAIGDGHVDVFVGGELIEMSIVSTTQVYLWTRGLNGTTAAPITTGEGLSVYLTLPKEHWAGSSWTKRFWLGGTPQPEVNIDNNLAYLESTRFIPNYDSGTVLSQAALASMYGLWTAGNHDIYDGVWNHQGVWTNAMGTTGARYDISPYPTWSVMWLYTGDWRLRQMSLGMADLFPAWAYHLRETVPTKTLLRTDAANSGTAMGRPISIISRPTLVTYEGDLNYETATADEVKVVGTVAITSDPWSYEGSHEPAAFYPEYILTGDPFYLGEMQMEANWDAARYIVDATQPDGRGPDGSYGGINDEVRGYGWVLRERAEAAFATPDGDPEKIYLGTLVNDALAREEGTFGVTGTAYTGSVMQAWGNTTGDYWTFNAGPNSGKVPTMHYWESDGQPVTPNEEIINDENVGWFLPGAVGTYTCPWMHWYSIYVLGRVNELGFAAKPFQEYSGEWLTDLINNSGVPTIISVYESPAEIKGGGFPATDAAWLALFTNSANSGTNQFTTCSGTMPSGQLCLADYFTSNLQPQGREAYAMAALAPLVDAGAPGASTAWTWMNNVVRAGIAAGTGGNGTFTTDPSWDIIPRTDSNVLPPQNTTLQ